MIHWRGLGLSIALLALVSACSGSDDAVDEPMTEGDPTTERDPLAAPADVQEPPADAEFTASGLASKVLVAGTGIRYPFPSDTVRVHYTGWQTNGRRFDSSRDDANMPIEFPLDAVIDGWTEGLQLMVEGEQRRLWIPEELAYKGSSDPRFPRGMLVFDVELLAIVMP